MGELDSHLQRLLKLAATPNEQKPAGAPFGFDTRVVAQWRALHRNDAGEVLRFVRRVAFVAVAITILGGVATYRQMRENEELGEPLTNDYAMADYAIEKQIRQ
jgi:hypothetical protein